MISAVNFGQFVSQPLQFGGGCASKKQPAFSGQFPDLKNAAANQVNTQFVSSSAHFAGLGKRLNVLA